MKKKALLFVLMGLAVVAGVILLVRKGFCDINKIDTGGIILFYGSGCPHCANVEKYLKANKVADRVQFTEREIFFNKCNAKLLEKLAVHCGLSTEEIGVPLLWDGSTSTDQKCLVGDENIINFFKGKIEG